jgi:hypothetical protein
MESAIWDSSADQRKFVLLIHAFRRALDADWLGVSPMSVHEGKYNYDLAGQFSRDYRVIDQSLTVPEFKKVASTFITSMDRIIFLFELPIQLIFWSGHLVRIAMTVRHRRGLDPNDSKEDMQADFVEQSQALYRELEPPLERVFRTGKDILTAMIDGEEPVGPASEGVEAAFAAMTTSAYAALETLAADLWIEAVNQHPNLARNWFEKNPDRQVPGSVLAGYGFNASNSMGTILHETRRVTFESWGDVRRAHYHAFKGELESAFEPWQPIYRAEKTRHLFAHRGGLVDRKFRDEMKDFPEYGSL